MRALLFDLDGVLIDSYGVWFHLQNHAARAFGYPAISDEAYRAGWGQSTHADRDAFFPGHEVSAIEAFYEAHYFEHVEHLEVPAEVPEVFARLRELGLMSAVCTNTQSSIASQIVKRAGASPDVVVGGGDVAHAKPDPDMLFRACELLGVYVEDAWMIGDSHYDRDAARGAGAYFVGRGIDGDVRIETLGELLELL